MPAFNVFENNENNLYAELTPIAKLYRVSPKLTPEFWPVGC
jgi:hypothetical protein